MIASNFKRGSQYFYAHKSTLACVRIGGSKMLGGPKQAVPLYLQCPEPRQDFHRVEVTVIHTKAEAKALNKKWAKRRADFAALLKRQVDTAAEKARGS